MSLNLVGFIKSLLPSFQKSDIETDMEISLEHVPVIIEHYSSLGVVIKDAPIQNKQSKDLIKTIYKDIDKAKVKLSRNNNIGQDIVTMMSNVKVNGEYLLKEISDSINDTIMSQALTAYKSNLLRTVPHFYFITRYALDLLNFLYIKEIEHAKLETDKGYGINKKQEEFLVKNAWMFSRLMALYGSDPEHFKKQMESLSDVTIPKDSVEEVVQQFSSDRLDIFNNLPNGFIGSPIYSIRLVFAQWEADRYRSLKNKRKLLELRLLHLKLQKEQGVSDTNTESEIIYLQQTVTDMDFKLSKIEADLE